jgi:hypothetical protein
MKSKALLHLLLALVLIAPGFGADAPTFIDQVGEFRITDSKDKIVVTEQGDQIQFRIRGSGPLEPAIQKKSRDWFIYVEDKNHYWVHLGGGRLFYYTWQTDSRARIDEWTYPQMGDVKLPKPVEDRINK